MGQLGSKMRRMGSSEGSPGGLAHYCPACKQMHLFSLDGYNSSGAKWRWDGSVEAPSFIPSMNIRCNMPGMDGYQPDAGSSVCHYYLSGGMIGFLPDCTHEMRGLSVPLPDLPVQYTDAYMGGAN